MSGNMNCRYQSWADFCLGRWGERRPRTASGVAAGGPHLDYIIKHFHIGIYGKRERESEFFVLGVN